MTEEIGKGDQSMSEYEAPRYMVYEQTTMGWNPVVEDSKGFERPECESLYAQMQESGVSPNDLKIARVN